MEETHLKAGILSGLLEYLECKLGVKDVSLSRGNPVSVSQITAWEKSNDCTLPEDLKDFFLTNNGLTLTWNYQYSDMVHSLGHIHVNPLQELLLLGGQSQPILFSQMGSVTSARQPSLSCLDIASTFKGVPSFRGCCKIFSLDFCPSCGHVCLVYNIEEDNASCVGGGVWLLDLSLSWHPLSSTFSDYLRLAVVHLGLPQWPYALTRHGLSSQNERWFRMFIPKRLETDLVLASTNQHNNTEVIFPVVVDTSKIVIMKHSKEKKSSKSESKPQATSRRHTSNRL